MHAFSTPGTSGITSLPSKSQWRVSVRRVLELEEGARGVVDDPGAPDHVERAERIDVRGVVEVALDAGDPRARLGVLGLEARGRVHAVEDDHARGALPLGPEGDLAVDPHIPPRSRKDRPGARESTIR